MQRRVSQKAPPSLKTRFPSRYPTHHLLGPLRTTKENKSPLRMANGWSSSPMIAISCQNQTLALQTPPTTAWAFRLTATGGPTSHAATCSISYLRIKSFIPSIFCPGRARRRSWSRNAARGKDSTQSRPHACLFMEERQGRRGRQCSLVSAPVVAEPVQTPASKRGDFYSPPQGRQFLIPRRLRWANGTRIKHRQ
jgi:hypothetical protein